MQGQRSNLEPYEEFGSNSGNSGWDQHIVWNNMPGSTVENQNLPVFPLSNDHSSMTYGNVASHESTNSSICGTGDTSLNLLPPNNGSHGELALEIGWTSTTPGSSDGGQRREENRPEDINTLSLENVDIDLNRNDIDNGQLCLQTSDWNGHSQNLGYDAQRVCVSSQVHESGLSSQPSCLGLLHPQYDCSGSSSGSLGSSSRGVQPFPDNYGSRHAVPFDGQCFSHKRKSGVSGQSSMSGSSSSFNQGPPTQEEKKAMTSGHQSFGSTVENVETTDRNTRMRIENGNLSDTSAHNIWPQGVMIRHSNSSFHHPVSSSILSDQSMDSRLGGNNASLHVHPHVHIVPSLLHNDPPLPWNEIPSTRVGGSSRPLPSTVERSAVGDTLPRIVSRDNIAQHPVIVPLTNTRPSVADITNWGLVNGSTVTPQNAIPALQAGSNVGFYQPLVNRASSHRLRRLSEIHALPSVSYQSMNLPPHYGHFPTSQEIGHNQTGVLHGQQRPHISSQLSTERQNGGALNRSPSVQSLAASMERRSRILAEFINRHSIFRGDNLTLQDVLVFEHSLLHRGAAFVDRHRDMRLDVDNMSYEELLALEERIGNVNTGLSEEKILKCLKQWKYVPVAPEPLTEVEPCCICQEEYKEGQELGRLDCGHDFHTDCIKQWLIMKNLCPICKTAAFNT